jgi:hypothetical protein
MINNLPIFFLGGMKPINEFIRRYALVLVLAGLVDNFKDTWNKMKRDVNKFKEVTDPFIQRYLDTNTSNQDINVLRAALLKATGDEVGLSLERGKWVTMPKRRSILFRRSGN